MPKTVLFRTRVDARRKKNAERILAKVGLTPGQLVNMVFAQVELKNGLPFAVNAYETDDGHLPHVPNAETLAAIQEKPGKRFSSPEGFLADLKPVSLADAMGDLIGSVKTGRNKKSLAGYGRD